MKPVPKFLISLLLYLLGIVFICCFIYFDADLYNALLHVNDDQYFNFGVVGFLCCMFAWFSVAFVEDLFDFIAFLIRRFRSRFSASSDSPKDPG